jgi:hypothetical protein
MEAERRRRGVRGGVAACLLAAAVSVIVIGALALSRHASAEAPDEGFIVPPGSELSDDEFIIQPDTDLIGLPVIGLPGDGMGGALTQGAPTVGSLLARCIVDPPPEGWNWQEVGPGDALKVRGGCAVRFKAVPAGGDWEPNQPTWRSGSGSTTSSRTRPPGTTCP